MFTHEFMNSWGVSTFGCPEWRCCKHLCVCFCGRMSSFLSGICLGVELLSLMVTLRLTFWGAARRVFKAAVPLYIFISSVWRFLSPSSPALTVWLWSSSHVSGATSLIFVHIFLMSCDAENLFMSSLAVCMSLLEKYLFVSFAHLLIGLSFYYQTKNFQDFILDTSSLDT